MASASSARTYAGPSKFLIASRAEHLDPSAFSVTDLHPVHGQHGLSLRPKFSARRSAESTAVVFSPWTSEQLEWSGEIMLPPGFCFGAKRQSAVKEGKQTGFVVKDPNVISFFDTVFLPSLRDALAARATVLFANKAIELSEDRDLLQAKVRKHKEVADSLRRAASSEQKVREAQLLASNQLLEEYMQKDSKRAEDLRARLDRWVRGVIMLEKSPNQRLFSGVFTRSERTLADGTLEVSHILNADIYDTRDAPFEDMIDCKVHVDREAVPAKDAFAAIEGKGFETEGCVVAPRFFVAPSDSLITIGFTLRQIDRVGSAAGEEGAKSSALADLPIYDMFEDTEEEAEPNAKRAKV